MKNPKFSCFVGTKLTISLRRTQTQIHWQQLNRKQWKSGERILRSGWQCWCGLNLAKESHFGVLLLPVLQLARSAGATVCGHFWPQTSHDHMIGKGGAVPGELSTIVLVAEVWPTRSHPTHLGLQLTILFLAHDDCAASPPCLLGLRTFFCF